MIEHARWRCHEPFVDVDAKELEGKYVLKSYGTDPRRYLVVNRRLPPQWLLTRIVRSGRGVHVLELPRGHRGIDFLQPVLPMLEALIITDRECTDLHSLRDAKSLKILNLWASPDSELSFTHVPLVEFAGGADKNLRSLREVSTLEDLFLEGGDLTWIEGASFTLKRLQIAGSRRVDRLPVGDNCSKLEFVAIADVKNLEVADLALMPSVRTLELTNVKKVTGFAQAGLERLDSLVLEDIGEIDDPESILQHPPKRLLQIGTKQLFCAEIMFGPVARERDWKFPPIVTDKFRS